MPIYKAGVLKGLIADQNLIVKDFEAKLGYSNGGLAKAIADNSKLKQDRVDRLFSIFPNLSGEWLQTGKPPIFRADNDEDKNKNARSSILEEPGVKYASVDQLIKDQQDLMRMLSETQATTNKTAQAAIEAAQAATMMAGQITVRLSRIEGRNEADETMLAGIQVYLTRELGKIRNVDPEVIEAEIGNEVMRIQRMQKTGTQTEAGI